MLLSVAASAQGGPNTLHCLLHESLALEHTRRLCRPVGETERVAAQTLLGSKAGGGKCDQPGSMALRLRPWTDPVLPSVVSCQNAVKARLFTDIQS